MNCNHGYKDSERIGVDGSCPVCMKDKIEELEIEVLRLKAFIISVKLHIKAAKEALDDKEGL